MGTVYTGCTTDGAWLLLGFLIAVCYIMLTPLLYLAQRQHLVQGTLPIVIRTL